jgi:hypothetical protein
MRCDALASPPVVRSLPVWAVGMPAGGTRAAQGVAQAPVYQGTTKRNLLSLDDVGRELSQPAQWRQLLIGGSGIVTSGTGGMPVTSNSCR